MRQSYDNSEEQTKQCSGSFDGLATLKSGELDAWGIETKAVSSGHLSYPISEPRRDIWHDIPHSMLALVDPLFGMNNNLFLPVTSIVTET